MPPAEEPSDAQVRAAVRACFTRCSTLSLATVDDQGSPHAANLYFAADPALKLHFVSDPASLHCRHLQARPVVAATVYEPVDHWQEIRGVQLHGRAAPINDREWETVWRLYLDRFPGVADMEHRVRKQRFYRITPNWLRWIDNTVRFGFKRELTLDE